MIRHARSDFGPASSSWGGRRMSQRQFVAKLCVLHGLGWSQRKIATYLGGSRAGIRGAMARLGLAPRAHWDRPYPAGDRHPRWVGSRAEYRACHDRVRAVRGAPSQCEECRTTDKGKTYEWANQSGKFYDPADYRRLCRSCHRKFDHRRRVADRLAGRN